VKPKGQQFRLGGAIEQPITAKLESAPGQAPRTADIPWTAAMGIAYQFGRRKLNPPFVTVGDRVRKNTGGCAPTYADWQRAERELYEEYLQDQTWYLLVSAQLSLIEGGGDVALGSHWAIDRPLVSPRLGLESEVVPRYLRLRGGSYLELATTEGGNARVHGTAGVDVKLFEWDVFGLVRPFDYWQLSLAADAAKAYLNTSFSIGFWH
jgi:hypothetical protein